MAAQYAVCPAMSVVPAHSPMTPIVRQAGTLSPFETTITYLNYTCDPIAVALRNGLKFICRPIRSFELPEFKIRFELRFKEEIKNDIVGILSVVDNGSDPGMVELKEAVEKVIQFRPAFNGYYEVVLDFPINIRTIEDHGGTVYIQDADVVLSLEKHLDKVVHPYSFEGQQKSVYAASTEGNDPGGFQCTIDLIDNDGQCGSMFFAMNGVVHRIQARRDSTKRTGVYITNSRPVVNEFSITDPAIQFIPIQDDCLNKARIYRTYKEAEASGDVAGLRKENILQLEYEITVAKQETALLKDQLEKAAQARIAAADELAAERTRNREEMAVMRERLEHASTMERMRAKDQYEEASHDRKDKTELLKYIPAVVVGVGAILAAWKKWF